MLMMASTSKFSLSKGQLTMDEIIERTFAIEGTASLKINNMRGRVVVLAGAEDEILVKAVKHTNTGDAERTEIEVRQKEDGKVIAETRFDKSFGFLSFNWPCKVTYTVRVPSNCSVDVNGVSCDTNLSGLQGDSKVNSVSGVVRLSDLSGDINIASVSGKILTKNLSGALNISSVSGAVEVKDANLASIKGNTTSGRFVLHTSLAEGPYSFNSVSGNVTLVIPEGTGCEARLKAVSGRLKTSLPYYTSGQRRKFRDHAVIQGGGPMVNCNAVSGSLRIVNAESERVQVVKETLPKPRLKSNLEILNQVDKGELSVDEALTKLN